MYICACTYIHTVIPERRIMPDRYTYVCIYVCTIYICTYMYVYSHTWPADHVGQVIWVARHHILVHELVPLAWLPVVVWRYLMREREGERKNSWEKKLVPLAQLPVDRMTLPGVRMYVCIIHTYVCIYNTFNTYIYIHTLARLPVVVWRYLVCVCVWKKKSSNLHGTQLSYDQPWVREREREREREVVCVRESEWVRERERESEWGSERARARERERKKESRVCVRCVCVCVIDAFLRRHIRYK
jgi:hypothetical protein